MCYNNHKKGLLPPGACIVIRKSAWEESVPNQLFLSGPKGKLTSAKGEDIEFLSYMEKDGWEIWYCPQMKAYHYIPETRLAPDYLIKFIGNSGLSRHHIRMVRLASWKKPFAFVAYFLNDFRKVVLYFIQNYQLMKTDVVACCEMRLLFSIWLSPFYIWKMQITNQYAEVKAKLIQ